MDEAEWDEVMLRLGQTVFAAQAFELNLGTTLIALTVAKGDRSKFPNEMAVRDWLAEVDRLTIGQIKGQLRALNLLPEKMIEDIGEINRMRIEVAHHFANRWIDTIEEEDGRAQAMAQLDEYHDIFLAAARKLQDGLVALGDVHLLS